MNKQFVKGLVATVFVVSLPLQTFAVGGIGKQMQMHVGNVDKALSLDALEKALNDLKANKTNDQTLTAKNRKHLLNYVKKMKNHPDVDHRSVLKFDNERTIGKVIENSVKELRNSGASQESINKFLDLEAGHIATYQKPRALKDLRRNLKARPSRVVEPMKKTDPTIDKWRTSERAKKTTGLAGQLPKTTKASNVSKTSKALALKRAAKGEMRDVSKPRVYTKSKTQVLKEAEERRLKAKQDLQKEKEKKAQKAQKKSIREKREERAERLKKIRAAQ